MSMATVHDIVFSFCLFCLNNENDIVCFVSAVHDYIIMSITLLILVAML